MNKKLLGLALAVALLAPSFSLAATNTYAGVPNSVLQQLLSLLVQEVAQLEQQLAQQQAQINTITATSTVATTTATSSPIVQQLQNLLPTSTPSSSVSGVSTANITANGSTGSITIAYDNPVKINWSSTNATSCEVAPLGESGLFGTSGSINPTNSQTYTVSCSGANGSASASVTVNVLPSNTTTQNTVTNNNSLGNVVVTSTPDVELTTTEQYYLSRYGDNEEYPKVRTDDPADCPQPTDATTTTNMAWLDTLSKGEGPWSGNYTLSTFNGLDVNSLYANPNFGDYNVTTGEQVTLTGDFSALYCTNYQPQENGNALPSLTSTTTYTFTVPSREFAGDIFHTIGGAYYVVSSTVSTTQ